MVKTFSKLGHVEPQILTLRALPPCVHIFIANNIIFTKVTARLHFNQGEWQFAGIFHPVNSPQWDLDRLVFTDQFHFIVNSDFGSACDNDPMFRSVVVRLQR